MQKIFIKSKQDGCIAMPYVTSSLYNFDLYTGCEGIDLVLEKEIFS
jgi:hypothetical protein